MAGSHDTPEIPNPFRKPKPEVKVPKGNVTTFSCGKCGGPVDVRYPGHSLSTVCPSCNSVIDTSNESFAVIATYYKQLTVHPRIELGTRGELMGKTWEVIGFVVRQDLASSFKWEEYLLFNPFHGYRWLTCNNGHWNFVTMIKDRPDRVASYANLEGDKYKIFYQGKASVFFVLGEFYWKVAVGEEVQMADYILPPYALSVEEDGTQRVWSKSEYITPNVIKDAFKVDDDSIATPIGVAPNQPSAATKTWNKVAPMWALFLVILTVLQITHLFLTTHSVVYDQPIAYTTRQEGAIDPTGGKAEQFTTPEFVITKNNSNVEVKINTDLDNSWLYVYGELVNSETDETFSFDRSIEYYHGYEGGESWSEGGTSSTVLIDSVPAGTYFINLETDNGATGPANRHQYQLTLTSDIGTFGNYLWCFFFLSIIPIFVWFKSRAIEVARWSDSDYSPYVSSS
ncbi:MAG: DUF4178 domain-containing protein [Candidatus Melainabacteria bacterium]|nr:DUF4178 domain-containing protein [Candidatus Melainabacteria bacterium]